MREYFRSNKNERDLLLVKLNKMCKEFSKHVVEIPESIPDYLTP